MSGARNVHPVLSLSLGLGLLLGATAASLARPAAGLDTRPSAKIDQRLLRATLGRRSASFIILLDDQADVSAAYAMADPSARGWHVFRMLYDHAERTQADLRLVLQQAGASFQPFWVANAIAATGDRALITALAQRGDVRAIEENGEASWIEPPVIAGYAPDGPVGPGGPEWGVASINAPQVWDLGYTGAGMVIGNADTGMQWDHPAIQGPYRGWDGKSADHNYNWHDAIHNAVGNSCGNDSLFPCDDNGHGTHTTGTTTGDDGAGNQVGVAPSAQWIGCRNMDRGFGTPARYTECFQFFIAPTDLSGSNPDPDLRPHVINNSWGCPGSEGCAPNTLKIIVENTEAAGIFVEVSAGNAGPGCGSVNDPPAIYDAVFSTGAHDSGNKLAGFSSRGAVVLDGSGRLKPDLAAPGVQVRSSVPGDGYARLSGTSMAGPHVVGAVALLWSARPELVRQIDDTRRVLRDTAADDLILGAPQTCGGTTKDDLPNNLFGYGRVDVLGAVNSP